MFVDTLPRESGCVVVSWRGKRRREGQEAMDAMEVMEWVGVRARQRGALCVSRKCLMVTTDSRDASYAGFPACHHAQ